MGGKTDRLCKHSRCMLAHAGARWHVVGPLMGLSPVAGVKGEIAQIGTGHRKLLGR